MKLASAASAGVRAAGRRTWHRMHDSSCPVVMTLGAPRAWPRRARSGGPESPGAAAAEVEAATWRWVDKWVIGMVSEQTIGTILSVHVNLSHLGSR